jgi:glucose/arabinose dehydrogenase
MLRTIVSAAIAFFLLGSSATMSHSQTVKTIDNPVPQAILPPGFTETSISGGLSNTTAMALHPDGRIFVCQQTGELRIIKNGVVLPTPFLTLPVNSVSERGLLGVAFDPAYATNRFIYVYYTATTPAIHNRVSRFTAGSANEDVVVAGSEVVILDLENLSAGNHNGGAIHFGPDGKLYIATGENAVTSNSQSLANRLGKILRINSDGTIPVDNPTSFPNIDGSPTGVNRAIWAVGLRNPFTFSFQPGTGRMHINDVGAGTWEEINVGSAGANFGWPTCEGTCSQSGMTNPIYQYSSAVAAPCAITGGAFYNPTTPTFPSQYIGKYFFADFCAGWIKTIDPLNPPATGTAVDAFTNISLPVDIQVANDGSLYYLARGVSAVFRVQFGGSSVLAINDVQITEGNAGTSVATFNVTLSPASSETVTVNYATANNTASAGTDYVAAGGTLTFAPGQLSQAVSVTINGDTSLETDERFNVNLSSPVNATLGDNQGVGTIVNDDGQPAISINNVSVVEGNSGTTTATFTVSLSNTSSQTVTVNYASAGNTATSGTDFNTTSGTATITPGLLSTTINVTVNSDTTFETSENFFVNLTNPINATISDNQGTGTINNDDVQPAISINNVSVAEGNTGTRTAGFTVSLSNPGFQTITVNYATANGTATAGSDYVAASGSLTFTPGQTSQPLNLTVNGDTILESNETFNVNLSSATNASIADSQGVGTITNDDGQPAISINNVSLTEGNSGTVSTTFTVSLSNASSQTITTNFQTANGSATAGADYVAASGTVTFTPGQLTRTINVTINGETVFEPNETFTVNLSGATNAMVADNQGVATITNDDGQPAISINNTSVTEGNTGTRTAGFTVLLSNPSFQTVTVNYATANGTATAGSDYLAAGGVVTFTPGQTSRPINVTVNGDTILESSESFNVNLSSAANASIADNQGVGTITNDDGQPAISINNVTLSEGDSGTTSAGFTVSLSNASNETITVNFATANNTAIAGTHYVSTSGTLTFSPGTTTRPVNVQVNGDAFNEAATLIFHVNLSAATNASIADNQGVGTIEDDDDPVLATEENSQRAIALNALFFFRDPFAITNPDFLGTDRRARVALFATNLIVTPSLMVTAEAVDSQQITHQLPVEFAGSLPTFLGFTQLNVRLPDGITVAGDLRVSIMVNGRKSNVVLIGVRP